jgi:hypothetical protein
MVVHWNEIKEIYPSLLPAMEAYEGTIPHPSHPLFKMFAKEDLKWSPETNSCVLLDMCMFNWPMPETLNRNICSVLQSARIYWTEDGSATAPEEHNDTECFFDVGWFMAHTVKSGHIGNLPFPILSKMWEHVWERYFQKLHGLKDFLTISHLRESQWEHVIVRLSMASLVVNWEGLEIDSASCRTFSLYYERVAPPPPQLDATPMNQQPTWNWDGRMDLDGTTNDIQPIVVVFDMGCMAPRYGWNIDTHDTTTLHPTIDWLEKIWGHSLLTVQPGTTQHAFVVSEVRKNGQWGLHIPPCEWSRRRQRLRWNTYEGEEKVFRGEHTLLLFIGQWSMKNRASALCGGQFMFPVA